MTLYPLVNTEAASIRMPLKEFTRLQGAKREEVLETVFNANRELEVIIVEKTQDTYGKVDR